jgi:hypothetical protein
MRHGLVDSPRRPRVGVATRVLSVETSISSDESALNAILPFESSRVAPTILLRSDPYETGCGLGHCRDGADGN